MLSLRPRILAGILCGFLLTLAAAPILYWRGCSPGGGGGAGAGPARGRNLGPCVGAADCAVCSNCSRCRHCAKEGGTCGVKEKRK